MNSRGGASGSAASIGLVRVPEIEESLAAIVHAIRGQQFAVEVALARGLDPDNPAGLTKVTPTS
jgi:glucosamine--fructose-6-phosphate aminotransferase (isomerizing)